MTTATALCASLLCVSMCAAATEKGAAPVFACNLKAISAAERPRYNDLVKRIRAAIRDRSEISNGYAFKMDGKAVLCRKLLNGSARSAFVARSLRFSSQHPAIRPIGC
jgi:hypothetical protein